MANRRYATFDYSEGCIADDKRTITLEHRYNAANFRIPFRINWAIILIIVVSISVCQFVESIAERQILVSINSISNKYHHVPTFAWPTTLQQEEKKTKITFAFLCICLSTW